MAVLSGATASGRNMVANGITTSWSVYYTAPAQSTNVTSPSSTAYIKEVMLVNTTASAITVTFGISNSTTPGTNVSPVVSGLSIPANDSKILSGLNTMLPAGWTIQAQASTTGINLIVSGTEVQ